MKIVTNGRFYRIKVQEPTKHKSGFLTTSEGIYETRFLWLAERRMRIEQAYLERAKLHEGPWWIV